MPYVGHLPADRTWAQDIKDLFETIQQVKQQRRDREIGQRLMDIIAGGEPARGASAAGVSPAGAATATGRTPSGGFEFGGEENILQQIAQELSRKPEGAGGISGMLDVFNPMTPSRRTSPLENALQTRIMETSMDPLSGLRRERLEAGIGLTKARTKAMGKPPEIKPQKMITVYDPNTDASYYHVFNPETGEYRNTGKMNKKPEAKWGQIQRAGPDETLPVGTLYQTNEAGEIKPIRWPQEVKPPKMIEVPDENGIVWYHEFNPKKRAYEKTDMMAEGAGEKFGVTPWYLSEQWINTPQGKKAQEKALKKQAPEERMKWLQTLLRSAQGPYYGTAEYKEPLNPQLAEWAEKELKKLPMFKEGESITKGEIPEGLEDIWDSMTEEEQKTAQKLLREGKTTVEQIKALLK